MDDRTRLLMVEWLVFAIAEKVGVDAKPIVEEAQRVQRLSEERERMADRLEEDETFRRSRAVLAQPIRRSRPRA